MPLHSSMGDKSKTPSQNQPTKQTKQGCDVGRKVREGSSEKVKVTLWSKDEKDIGKGNWVCKAVFQIAPRTVWARALWQVGTRWM